MQCNDVSSEAHTWYHGMYRNLVALPTNNARETFLDTTQLHLGHWESIEAAK